MQFLNDDNSLFALSFIPDKIDTVLQKCVDSSRGYAIKIEDPKGGRSTWVGLAFRDRNDAFDFMVCFEDFQKNKSMDKNPQKYIDANEPTRDFSLRSGEKISLNIASDAPAPAKNFGGGSKPA